MRLDVNEAPIDLPIGRPALDRRDRLPERPVVEHRAVDERDRGRIDTGPQMVVEGPFDKFGAPRPAGLPLGHQIVHLHDPRRREGARERRGRARGKGQHRGVVEIEIALDLAVGPAPIAEPQHVVMVQLVDQRRIVNLHELVIAVIVGERHEQIEALTRGQERGGRVPWCTHRGHRVVEQGRHDAATERRAKPARAHEQGKFLADFEVADRAQHAGARRSPQHRPQEPFAPGARARIGRQQHRDVGVVEPKFA